MQIIIDRFEGEFAVVELPDRTFLNIPKKLFSEASEGDVFDILKNDDETNKRQKETDELIKKLFK